LLDAWSKAGGKGCEAKAEAILRSMASPDEISWNTVISGYANGGSKQTLIKSLHLLKEMEGSATPPSAVTYNLVMDALARKGTVENAEKVEKLLDKMEMLYESGKESIKPNGLSYNIALNAWAKSGSPNSGEKAQLILKRMTDNAVRWNSSELSPDVVSYASTIDSLANSGKKGAAHEAEQLFAQYVSGWWSCSESHYYQYSDELHCQEQRTRVGGTGRGHFESDGGVL
jgi:hypothetical protein